MRGRPLVFHVIRFSSVLPLIILSPISPSSTFHQVLYVRACGCVYVYEFGPHLFGLRRYSQDDRLTTRLARLHLRVIRMEFIPLVKHNYRFRPSMPLQLTAALGASNKTLLTLKGPQEPKVFLHCHSSLYYHPQLT